VAGLAWPGPKALERAVRVEKLSRAEEQHADGQQSRACDCDCDCYRIHLNDHTGPKGMCLGHVCQGVRSRRGAQVAYADRIIINKTDLVRRWFVRQLSCARLAGAALHRACRARPARG
jgi:G3E family GTPase